MDKKLLEETLAELIDCLLDIASGRGGWAWEEVIDDAKVTLDMLKSEED